MLRIEEPVLKVFTIAMVLLNLTLVSQPIWAM